MISQGALIATAGHERRGGLFYDDLVGEDPFAGVVAVGLYVKVPALILAFPLPETHAHLLEMLALLFLLVDLAPGGSVIGNADAECLREEDPRTVKLHHLHRDAVQSGRLP